MNQKINDICKEVILILAFCDNDVIKKIPSKILIKINELAAESSITLHIDKEKNLLDQNISENSKDFIALLYYTYIATEKEKNELSKIWDENDKKYEEELKKKYDSNNIFKTILKEESDNINAEENSTNMSMIEYKESFFTKLKEFIFNKILHLKK